MPDITITLTSDQVTRVRNTLGVNTAPEVAAILREYLRSLVLNSELNTEVEEANSRAATTINGEGW